MKSVDVLIINDKCKRHVKIEIKDSNQCNRFRSAKQSVRQIQAFLPVSDKLGLHIYFCNTLSFLCNRCRYCKLTSTPIFLSISMGKILVSLRES